MEVALIAKLFRGLGDPTRLAMLQELRKGERRVADLVEITGKSQPNVSLHIACLRDCGLVVGRPQGRETYYGLASERLEDLFLAAQDVVAQSGGHLCECSHYQEENSCSV